VIHHLFGVAPKSYQLRTICGTPFWNDRFLDQWDFVSADDPRRLKVTCEECVRMAWLVHRKLVNIARQQKSSATMRKKLRKRQPMRRRLCDKCRVSYNVGTKRTYFCPKCSSPLRARAGNPQSKHWRLAGYLTIGNQYLPVKYGRRKREDDDDGSMAGPSECDRGANRSPE
jgi:hypothetical protein